MAETHFPTMEGCLHNPWGRHHYRQSLASSDGRCRFGNTALMIGALAQENSAAVETARPASVRDGQRDFDWEFGKCHTQLWRLKQPLSGSNEWLEYDGTMVV